MQFDSEPGISTDIPDLVRAWASLPQVVSVRRPSTLPDPQSYHVLIDPQAIFELEEEQGSRSTEVILVVPYSCTKCRVLKQACSRARPACARCAKTGSRCDVRETGYQRLPRPKVVRGQGTGRTKMDGGAEGAPPPSMKGPRAGRARTNRVVSGSKRSLSSESESDSESDSYAQPRKKQHVKTRLQKRKTGHYMVMSSDEMDTESDSTLGPSMQAIRTVALDTGRNTATWKFVNYSRMLEGGPSQEQDRASSIPSDSPVPRVWTNSLQGLLNMFPELAKSSIGFSWFQSETPILLLDTDCARSHWINSTTLSIDLSWDFDCHDSDLEPVDESNTVDPAHLSSYPSTMHPSENALGLETETMDSLPSCVSSATGSSPTDETISTSVSDAGMLCLDDMRQDEQHTYESEVGARIPTLNQALHDVESSAQLELTYPMSPPRNAPSQPRIPLIAPDEVETLLNSKLRYIPLLVWISQDCELAPCKLPPEYAYLCMGFFFISDLRHTVTRHGICSSTGNVQGQVCWNVTLEWAPGGEDALFDCNTTPSSVMVSAVSPPCTTKDLSNPWWFRPAEASLQDDNVNPKNLRMQIFSCIPLDLLAEFHPSEVFPRGWFCKSCGMINIQLFFRHQICQSSMCRPRVERGVPQGKADPLPSLRGAYQCGTLIRPTNRIPSVVATDRTVWDDDMQSWSYCIRDGVTLCHVFTGNQEHLQEGACALLERIQCEALLRKENRLSPYFVHTTKLLHPSDGSETRVPGGTPDCVRIAYYTLCDFIHRYADMDKPRFGEVRIQAWVNSGSKRGGVLRASKSPIVIHCLGAEVVLNFTPKGGYKDAAASTTADKGKEPAQDNGQADLLSAEPCGGPSCLPKQDPLREASSVSGPETNEMPTGVEEVDETSVAREMVSQCSNFDAGSTAATDADNPRCDPGTETACQEATKPGKGRIHKKNKVIKDKNSASVPEISMTLVHGDCVVLFGDDFECQIVRSGTTILVIGFPEET